MESEPKTNGAMTMGQVQPRDFSSTQLKRIVIKYQRKGRKATLEKYGLTDPQLYAILHAQGARLRGRGGGNKNGRKHPKPHGTYSRKVPYRGSAPKKAAPRASYKPAGRQKNGGATDALVYLGKARERLIRSLATTGEDSGAILGLVALAIEALSGE
jgi:hypothetical protein